jgi:excisionase family DNA binding protein
LEHLLFSFVYKPEGTPSIMNSTTTKPERSMAATKQLLTVDEAAAYLGISKLTVYDWISKRKIQYVKVGRLVKFDLQTLDKRIDQQTVKAIQPQKAA